MSKIGLDEKRYKKFDIKKISEFLSLYIDDKMEMRTLIFLANGKNPKDDPVYQRYIQNQRMIENRKKQEKWQQLRKK